MDLMKRVLPISRLVAFGCLCLLFDASLLTASEYGVGPNPYAPPAHMSLREQSAVNPMGLALDVASGIGRYQDIQAPVSSTLDGRVDGTKLSNQTSATHAGPIISGRLSWSNQNSYGQQSVGFNGMRMSAMPSTDKGAGGSSYSRLSLDGGANWALNPATSILTGAEMRRSIFRNTDSGHYIDSVILRSGLNQKIENFNLGATIGFAPISQFGYMQNSNNGPSGGLASSTSSLYEWGATASWSPLRDASLFVGLSDEIVEADVPNVGSYKALGLNVADDDQVPANRRYHLSTMALTIGATRRF